MNTVQTVGCAQCEHLEACGGLRDNPNDLYGCFSRCETTTSARRLGCANGLCDLACPNNPRLLYLYEREVGGLGNTECKDLLGLRASSLPPYIAHIRRGPDLGAPFSPEVVAVGLYQAVAMMGKGASFRPVTAGEFRRRMNLRADAKVLLLGNSHDPTLETFWSRFRGERLADHLRELDLLGVTVPNFSFAKDVPRYEHLRSRRRIMILAEEFSKAGIPIALHVNAVNQRDWEVWAEVLRANPSVDTICQEFDTGLAGKDETLAEFECFLRLERQVGRPLRAILIGGGRYPRLLNRLPSWTVVSATPYMRATRRRRAEGTSAAGAIRWEKVPKAARLELFETNLVADRERILPPASPATSGFYLVKEKGPEPPFSGKIAAVVS